MYDIGRDMALRIGDLAYPVQLVRFEVADNPGEWLLTFDMPDSEFVPLSRGEPVDRETVRRIRNRPTRVCEECGTSYAYSIFRAS